MLIKFSSTDDFKSDVIPAAIVTDNKQLAKRGGSERFKNVKVAKNQTPVHIIALSDYESTGQNRNGDYWREKDCQNKHHTFVKSGRVHANHRNHPNDPVYGKVHASDHNDKMHRVELFLGLDTDNPGNRETLEKLSSGKPQAFSMACRVKWDRCSLCGHKAEDSAHRCEHIPSRLGEITKEGIMIGMENPDPDFFEISKVLRPADRVAWSLNSLKKESSDQYTPQSRYESNQKLAQEIYLPPSLTLSKYASSKRSLLNKLSKLEKHIDAVAQGKVEDSRDKYIKEQAPKLNATPQLDDKTISNLRSFGDHHKLLKALADKGIIFTPEEFCKYLFDNKLHDDHIEGMKSHLPGIFNNLDDEELHDEDFEPKEGNIPDSLMNMIRGLVGGHSLFGEPAQGRIMRITIIKSTPTPLKKESSDKSPLVFDKQIALKYASYQLSALNYLDENDKLTEDTILNTLILNRR